MVNKISNETKQEILDKVQNEGISVSELTKQYGISDKTIYRWLKEGLGVNPSFWKVKQLERENKELKILIGDLVQDLSKFKKNRGNN